MLGVLPITVCYLPAALGLLLLVANTLITAVVIGEHRLALIWIPFAAFFLVGGSMGLVALWSVALHRSPLRSKPLLTRRWTLLGLATGITAALPIALSLEGTNLPRLFRVSAVLTIVVAFRYAFVTEKQSIHS